MLVKAVIFDLDGTLIDSLGIWKEVDEVFLGRRGISVPPDLFDDMHTGNSFREVAEYFKQRFNLSESVNSIMKEWSEIVKDFYGNRVELRQDVKKLLAFLKTHKLKLGIGTSNSKILTELVLKSVGIYNYFDSIICGCSDIKGKPYPDIFLNVSNALQVKPNHIVVLEDSLPGVQAAKNAEMLTIAVKDEHSLKDIQSIKEIADYYTEDYLQVYQIFKDILA